MAGRSEPRRVAAGRQHGLVGRTVDVIVAVVAVAAAAGVAQVLRQLVDSRRVHQLLHLRKSAVPDDAEKLLLAALNELLVDELLVVAAPAVETKLSCCDESDDAGGDDEAEQNAEKVVLVDGWIDDSLGDDVDQFRAEFIQPFFKPDQRQDGVIYLSIGKLKIDHLRLDLKC